MPLSSSDRVGDIWAFSERLEVTMEILAAARTYAEASRVRVVGILMGSEREGSAPDLIAHGADKVYVLKDETDDYQSDVATTAITQLAVEEQPSIIMIGGTRRGKELAPRIATRLKVGCVPSCTQIKVDESGRTLLRRVVYIGKGVATITCHTKTCLCTIPPRAFERFPRDDSRKGEILTKKLDSVMVKTKKLSLQGGPKEKVDLTKAKVIVSAGRGVKSQEDLKIIRELGEVLGGEVGCSRPLSSDYGWLTEERHVGISGITVRPQLYVAIGISGQTQHVAAIRDSRIIVAINTDKEAPIFAAADYGVVGDLYKVVPELAEAFRQILTK